MDKQAVSGLLTGQPIFLATWDKCGNARCHQCGEYLAFATKNLKGQITVRTHDFCEKDGVWIHPEHGFSHLDNARERRKKKRERAKEMREQGESEESIQSEMEGLDWLFESARSPRQGIKKRPDGTIEYIEPRSMAEKTPRKLEDVSLPAIFRCPKCNSKSKIFGVGS